jgi:hypothetical protein
LTTEPPELIKSPAGSIVSFAASMELLQRAGIAVAPYVVLPPGRDDDPAIAALGDRLVVKLADVPHRTELNAVRLAVVPAAVPDAVRELRAIAIAHDQPQTVAVQAMVAGHGEAFVGLQGRTDLGPVVVFGLGGILVELTRKVAGRLLPLPAGASSEMVTEVAGPALRGQIRGQAAWPAAPLVAAVDAVAELWRQSGAWLQSADLNPLIVTDSGVIAVDALLVAG